MANQAPITPAALAATFDAARWLSHFESIGGGFLATESQTSLCIACQGTTPENESAAHAMLRDLSDEQRAGVIVHIRERAGLSAPQPDLKAVCSQEVSEPDATSLPSSGAVLDDQPKGPSQMDMSHAFALPVEAAPALDWDGAVAKYESLRALHVETSESTAGYFEEESQLSDAWLDAETAAINMPAPHFAAVLWKLGRLVEEGEGCEISFEKLRTIQGDVKRLLEAPSAARVEWDAVISAYNEAKDAYERHSREVHDPAGDNMTDDIARENNRLAEILTDCENAMIRAAAPDLRALRTKLDFVFKDDGDGYTGSWRLGYLEQTLAEIAHLLEGAKTDGALGGESLEPGTIAVSGHSDELDAADATSNASPYSIADFRAANQAYVAADKAMNEFHDQHYIPASDQWSAWRAQWPLKTPDSNAEYVASRAAASALLDPVQEQFNHLVGECSGALMTLISTPAPDITAVTRKVQVLIDAQEWDGGECESHLKHLMADLNRLGELNRQTLPSERATIADASENLTSVLVGYLAEHNAVLTLAEAKQVFDVTFQRRQAAGAAHTAWEVAEPHCYDLDHPIERAWNDSLRAHEASWKLLAGSSVETMAELEEKIALCQSDPDIEADGFRDLLINRIQSDMRQLSERRAA